LPRGLRTDVAVNDRPGWRLFGRFDEQKHCRAETGRFPGIAV